MSFLAPGFKAAKTPTNLNQTQESPVLKPSIQDFYLHKMSNNSSVQADKMLAKDSDNVSTFNTKLTSIFFRFFPYL